MINAFKGFEGLGGSLILQELLKRFEELKSMRFSQDHFLLFFMVKSVGR